jgi:hypothetical protein
MIHLPRRHFFNARNEIRWNKERKVMGGSPYMSSEFIRGEVPLRHTVQETIDSLNAAIDRLNKIIDEMKEQTNGTNN